MKLSELISDATIKPELDFEVAGIAIDSREVKNNFIFFALKGEKLDGADFIETAIKQGAKAIFTDSNIIIGNKNVFFSIGEASTKLNIIAQKFYSPLPDNLIAVTGTNGKTSVANFTASLLNILGNKSASIGTLGTLLNGDFTRQFAYSGLTSPDIITLLRDLNGLKKSGIDSVAIETSSHGLEQKRMGNLKFKTGAFTNFTQDHLDYHGTMENYFRAKMILFTSYIEEGGNAVLNTDIPEYEKIKTLCENKNLKIFSYGKNAGKTENDIKINLIIPHDKGLDVDVTILNNNHIIKTPLIGGFQAYNVVCAISILISLGFNITQIIEAAAQLKPVKGRMDVIRFDKQNAKIVIDYAHTPDALEKAIDSLRHHTTGKLITLFGCGGDRDKSKRPLMGKVAAEKSDIVIVTDDNPRTENADIIRAEIMDVTKNGQEIPGRLEAIKYGISLLKSGDSLLLAGKGHEDYQIIGKEKLPFDEFKIVNDILKGM